MCLKKMDFYSCFGRQLSKFCYKDLSNGHGGKERIGEVDDSVMSGIASCLGGFTGGDK